MCRCVVQNTVLAKLVFVAKTVLRLRLCVYKTVRRPSVCLCRRSTARAAGLMLSVPRPGDRSIAGDAAQQQRRRSKCGQCRVDSRVDQAEHRLVDFLISLLTLRDLVTCDLTMILTYIKSYWTTMLVI